ncbi:pseudouridine synthase [Tricladium varicosporioides]|nr:pseudouridine synthase [Hymenoscyphus varicosporioides]
MSTAALTAGNFWRMTKGKILEGVFAVNKPSGISSAQVVRELQNTFQPSKIFQPYLSAAKSDLSREKPNQRKRRRDKNPKVKIGHGGTLDPLATGVLIAGIGRGTKSLQDFLLCTKEYETVVLFGTATDTYDRVGKALKRAPFEHVTREKVEEALGQFKGKFMQLPPLFSALKMDGKPLYEYAREGKPIPRKIERRQVEVVKMELLEWMEGGTHSHQAPTEDAGYAEINVANQLWEQEKAVPGTSSTAEKPEEKQVEEKKRKASVEADDLVSERPASKQQKTATEEDAIMSGGLPPPTVEPSLSAAKSSNEPAFTINKVDSNKDKTNYDAPPTTKTSKTPDPSQPPACRIRMTVTSGFYVRSLAHDLGVAVNSAALMAELKRTRQGEFEVGKNVLEWEELKKGEEVWGPQVEHFIDDWVAKKNRGERGVREESVGEEREMRS